MASAWIGVFGWKLSVTSQPFLFLLLASCMSVAGHTCLTFFLKAPMNISRPSQLSMLSGIFPRHVIEFISLCSLKPASPGGGSASPGLSSAANGFTPELMGQLARTHDDVTVLFMDIVGEQDGDVGGLEEKVQAVEPAR